MIDVGVGVVVSCYVVLYYVCLLYYARVSYRVVYRPLRKAWRLEARRGASGRSPEAAEDVVGYYQSLVQGFGGSVDRA